MIQVHADTRTDSISLWLQADRALGWAENARHLRWHLLFMLGPGAGFVALGAWPVAVCLLLGSGLLALASWHALRRLAVRECITLTREHIRLQRGRRQPQQDRCCTRAGARLRVLRGITPWHEPIVLLDCDGGRWELGRDLGPGERRRLILLLGEAGLTEAGRDRLLRHAAGDSRARPLTEKAAPEAAFSSAVRTGSRNWDP